MNSVVKRPTDDVSARGVRALLGASMLLLLSCSPDDGTRADADSGLAPASDADAAVDARAPSMATRDGAAPRSPGESVPLDAGQRAPKPERDGGVEPGWPLDAAIGSDAARLDAAMRNDAAAASERDAARPPVSDAGTQGDAIAPSPPLSALTPRLSTQRYEGELCPADSLSISPAGDGSALTIVFSHDVQGDGTLATISRRCTIRLGFELPAGHALGNLHVYANGYADGTEGSAALTLDYSFAGEEATQRAHFAQLREDYVVLGRFHQVWSPSCAGDREVELVLDVDLGASGDQLLLLSALDMGFAYEDGAQWKRCADGTIVRPPPADKGQTCGGPARHPCAEGLACDLLDAPHGEDELLAGACTDPEERLPPAEKERACGGVSAIPCANGLRCHYTSEARARRDVRGLCAPLIGDAGDRCGGSPALPCAEGLFCNADARNRCEPGAGKLGGQCAGDVRCDEGLRCVQQRCVAP